MVASGRELSVQGSCQQLLDPNEATVHATPHITNLIRNGTPSLPPDIIPRLPELGLGVTGERVIALRPTDLDRTLETENFLIHYTLDQSDNAAVSPDDYDGNTVPDYVDRMATEFEIVWDFFLDSLGFDPPPDDGTEGGAGKYDIYLENLPSQYFAITYTSSAETGSSSSCASYIKMRNNYDASGFQGHTELENIQVTAVHEFFHSIQFAYNCYERFWTMEAAAVWSEDELYDDINDLYRYMPSWFEYPNRPIDTETTHMYGSFILYQYIDEHLGGPDMVRAIWEGSRSMASPVHNISFRSMDSALVSVGSSFKDALNRMRIANRILSSHPNAEPYTYAEAEHYPVSAPPVRDILFFERGQPLDKVERTLVLYASHYYTIDTSDPVRVSILDRDGPQTDLFMAAVFKHSGSTDWTIRTGHEINLDPDFGWDWLSLVISAQDDSGTDWDYELRLIDGESDDLIVGDLFPNPVTTDAPVQVRIFVVAPQTVYARIYNVLGQRVWSWEHEVSEPDDLTLYWYGRNSQRKAVSSGTYLMEIYGENRRFSRRLTLLRPSD